MKTTRLLPIALAAIILAAALPAFGQTAPKPKSQKEYDAIMAIQNAADDDARLKAIDTLLTKFADTEFKLVVLDMAVETARHKNDPALLTVWADRAIQANPKDYIAMIAVAQATALNIKEFDLNLKDEVARVEKNANAAIEALKDAPKPQPQLTDAQWAEQKKDITSSALEAIGTADMGQKKYAEAVTQFQASIAAAAHPDGATYVRLGESLLQTQKFDEAIAAYDKAMAVPEVSPQVKQVAQKRKDDAEKRKAAAAPKP
jgi:tetratricopeptide (TPR) repeat protein